MKLNVTITGLDTRRLIERVEQLARECSVKLTPSTLEDAPAPPSAEPAQPRSDRRS